MNISSSTLKRGPCGLLGLYNSLFTNFLDYYDTTAPDFKAKCDLLMSVAEKLTQQIKDEALLVHPISSQTNYNSVMHQMIL